MRKSKIELAAVIKTVYGMEAAAERTELYYRSGTCYQDRLRHGCCGRAYKDVFTACLDNSFQSDNSLS